MNDKFKNSLEKFLHKNVTNIFIILGLTGVILVFLSDAIQPQKNNKAIENDYTLDEYRCFMEENLCSLLSSVQGAGNVKVMITYESGPENVYVWQEKTAQDQQTSTYDTTDRLTSRYTYENELVMINAGNEKQALIERVLQPQVQGVVVVCTGADDISVVSDITNAVSVALNISSNRICVIKME